MINCVFAPSFRNLNSLTQNSEVDFYIKKINAEDELSFRKLCLGLDVSKYLNNSNNIRLLWDVCRIPDFQKIMKTPKNHEISRNHEI